MGLVRKSYDHNLGKFPILSKNLSKKNFLSKCEGYNNHYSLQQIIILQSFHNEIILLGDIFKSRPFS